MMTILTTMTRMIQKVYKLMYSVLDGHFNQSIDFTQFSTF